MSDYIKEYRRKNADKIKAQQAERDRRKREAREADPEAMKAYKERRRREYLKDHPNAQTKDERRRKDKRNIPTVNGLRVCCDCGESKPLEDFPRPGPRGRKPYCDGCSTARQAVSRKTSQAKYLEKNRPKINAVKLAWAKKNKPAPVAKAPVVKKTNTLKDAGWRLVFCFGDQYEICRVYMKGLIIRYVSAPSHRSYGDYTVGKSSYGIAFDDTGKRYQKLEQAERVAQ